MRELERDTPPNSEAASQPLSALSCLTIVGAGRLGRSLAAAADAAGLEVRLAGREEARQASAGAELVLLCVPDTEIETACEAAAGAEPRPRLIGHTSGAATLNFLTAAIAVGADTFSLHPLQTFPDSETNPQGAPCAIAGSTPAATAAARELAERLGMRPFRVPESGRAGYHAAASMASNFLVALEESAAELLHKAGVGEDARELLAPLVLCTAANWSERGGEALTGPIARGDEATVDRHRAAIAELAPELEKMYEAMVDRTRALADSAVAS
ncbi:MAG: Rossmann-like and DUF2520 domain-containing protein [Solirubrobacterales bacterium]